MAILTSNLTIQINRKWICQHLNWQIQPGEVWGILGPNGSGKTTLLHTLAGLKKPLAGEIYLLQKKLSELTPKKIARQLAILLQDTHPVFPQSVYEYCLAGRFPHLNSFKNETAEDHRITQAALEQMELSHFSQHNIFTLSGGERRRLAIATLITQTPKVYLLDEPINHLDLRHQIKVLDHFKYLASQKANAIVLSLHDVNLAQTYCDKILMLFDEGDVIQGSAKDILNETNLSRLYRLPFSAFLSEKRIIWQPI